MPPTFSTRLRQAPPPARAGQPTSHRPMSALRGKPRMRSPRKRRPTPSLARRCAPSWASIRVPPPPSSHSFPPMGSLSTRFTPPTRASLSTSPARRSSRCATAIAQRAPRSTSWAWGPPATASSCSRRPSAPTTTQSRPWRTLARRKRACPTRASCWTSAGRT